MGGGRLDVCFECAHERASGIAYERPLGLSSGPVAGQRRVLTVLAFALGTVALLARAAFLGGGPSGRRERALLSPGHARFVSRAGLRGVGHAFVSGPECVYL
jgi:hypothetical protein